MFKDLYVSYYGNPGFNAKYYICSSFSEKDSSISAAMGLSTEQYQEELLSCKGSIVSCIGSTKCIDFDTAENAEAALQKLIKKYEVLTDVSS